MQEKETVKEGVKQTETLAAEEKPVQEQNSEEKMDTDAADEVKSSPVAPQSCVSLCVPCRS